LSIEEGLIPASPGTREIDPALHARYEKSARAAKVDRVLSNSFGFGGSNCSLVLGRTAA
jgi:3-oxoacyl-[acyl-carrier-protein] synthase-1